MWLPAAGSGSAGSSHRLRSQAFRPTQRRRALVLEGTARVQHGGASQVHAVLVGEIEAATRVRKRKHVENEGQRDKANGRARPLRQRQEASLIRLWFVFVCQLNILEAAGPNDLPTAETCFFNLNLPLYKDYATLFAKLNLAITHCSSINS